MLALHPNTCHDGKRSAAPHEKKTGLIQFAINTESAETTEDGGDGRKKGGKVISSMFTRARELRGGEVCKCVLEGRWGGSGSNKVYGKCGLDF